MQRLNVKPGSLDLRQEKRLSVPWNSLQTKPVDMGRQFAGEMGVTSTLGTLST